MAGRVGAGVSDDAGPVKNVEEESCRGFGDGGELRTRRDGGDQRVEDVAERWPVGALAVVLGNEPCDEFGAAIGFGEYDVVDQCCLPVG